MIYQGFSGGSYNVRSRNAGAERTYNWYAQKEPGTPKNPYTLYPTPCIKPFVVLSGGPIRALFSQAGRTFAVAGPSFYEIFANRTAILRGTAVADGQPATIWSNGTNGNQLFVTSGGKGYIYDLLTNVITEVTTNSEPVLQGAYSDGYFFALKAQSNQFTISAIFDGTAWDPLDVFQSSITSDPFRAIVESHREIWLFGERTTTVWQNTGDADVPFQPIGGVKILQGIAAPFSAVSVDNTILWLGGNEIGNRIVYRADGYSPKRVSNYAVEFALDNYPRVDNIIGWTYQMGGHSFYVLYLPSPPNRSKHGIDWTHWVYDIAEDQWHQWETWDSTFLRFEPHFGRNHAYAFDKYHLVGDRQGPAIYELSQELAFDTIVQLGAA